MSKLNFKFYCPLEIRKSKDTKGEEVLKLGGIASTMDEDSDGEFLDPTGFELQEFMDYGIVNWHHQAKDKPSTIIGEPTLAEIRPEGLYVEVELYPDSAMAREVFDLAKVMSKNSKRRKLGFSIEGSVIEKDSINEKIIKKAVITGLAVTHMPKNPKTFADIIKGKVDFTEEEEDVEKSLDTATGAAVIKESVNYEIKDLTEEKFYDEVFKAFPDIDIKKAEEVYNLFNQIKEAMSKKTIGSEQLSKAMEVLGFGENDKNPFIQKAKPTPEEIADKVQKEIFKDEEEMASEETVTKGKEEADLKKGKETPAPAEPEDETMEKGKDTTPGKGEFLILKKVFEKGMKESHEITKAVGVVTKALLESNAELVTEVRGLRKSHHENVVTISELKEELTKAKDEISNFGNQTPGRKAIVKSYSEKESFNKAQDNVDGKPSLSKSKDFKAVLDIVDKYCEANGYRSDLSKAVIDFETTKQLPAAVAMEISAQLGVAIVD